MSKKILSMILAVMILVSAFSISAFAITAPAEGSVGIYVENDAKVGQDSGVVTAKVYWVFPEGTDFDTYLAQIGNIVLGYNNAKYEYVSREWSPRLDEFIKSDASYAGERPNLWKALGNGSKLTEAEKSYGYNCALQLQMPLDLTKGADVGVGAKTGFTLTPEEDTKVLVATLKFNVKAALTANDVMGVIEATLNSQTQVKKSDGKKDTKLNAVISGIAVPAGETYKVFDGDVKIRRNADNSAKYDLGFTGSFKKSDFPVVFNDAGTATNLTKVGVVVTVDGETREYTDRFVYETADGYQFRAVLAGLEDSMATKEISVVMFIVFDGVRYESKGITTTLGAHTGRLPA